MIITIYLNGLNEKITAMFSKYTVSALIVIENDSVMKKLPYRRAANGDD